MEKDFDSWNELKKKLNFRKNPPTFKEREVLWCSFGCNIGFEQDGKGERFLRPILIVRKFNKDFFLGLPLSTKIKNNEYYHKFKLDGNEQSLILSQMKSYDSRRLLKKIERISEEQFIVMKKAAVRYLFGM